MHESIINLNGYDITKYEDKYWLKIFHQNSRVCFFANKVEANYSIDKNCFSILSDIDTRFKINGNYSLLLEYPQLNYYIRWTQTSDFSDIANIAQNFNLISKSSGVWNRFKGIHSRSTSYTGSLYLGDSNNTYWFYSIGTIHNEFPEYNVMPANENQLWVQFVDLWLEIDDFEKMKFLPQIFIVCTNHCRTNFIFSFACYVVFILINDK